MLRRLATAALGVILMTSAADAQLTGPTPFGKTADGTPVETFTLKNKNGMTVKLMTLGATVMEINVPDKNGKFANVVLGFDDVAGYESKNNQFFGCTVGRVANRIANAKFTLEGKEYKLAANNGAHHLHGGVKRSLDKVVWKVVQGEKPMKGQQWMAFSYRSPDGEEGYPGNLDVRVDYELTEGNALSIHYSATTDKATPVNLTNHSYFNLRGAGAETVLDHYLHVYADSYIPVDETLIPTGKQALVKDTVFDFTKGEKIGARIDKLYKSGAKGYDHCYVLSGPKDKITKHATAARLYDVKAGRGLRVLTTQPGMQVYTGNFLFGQKGAGGKEYKQRSAVCLETGYFPDAVNQPEFPSIILIPGQSYSHGCTYLFTVE